MTRLDGHLPGRVFFNPSDIVSPPKNRSHVSFSWFFSRNRQSQHFYLVVGGCQLAGEASDRIITTIAVLANTILAVQFRRGRKTQSRSRAILPTLLISAFLAASFSWKFKGIDSFSHVTPEYIRLPGCGRNGESGKISIDWIGKARLYMGVGCHSLLKNASEKDGDAWVWLV